MKKLISFLFLFGCVQETHDFIICGAYYEGGSLVPVKSDCHSAGKVEGLEKCEVLASQFRRKYPYLIFHCE